MRYVYLILGAMLLIVGSGLIENKDRSLGVRKIPRRLEINRIQMAVIADGLRDYRRREGAFPSNDQGLQAVCMSESFRKIRSTAVSKGYAARVRISDGIPYTIWGEPFIYENRRGLPASRFAHSGASTDTRRQYSIRVDRDIYVWSLAAQEQMGIYASWSSKLGAFLWVVLVVSLLLMGLYVVLTIRSASRWHHGRALVARAAWSLLGGASIVVVIAAALFPVFVKTCYASSINRPPSDKLRKDYTSLIAKYHERGIISDSAREKLVNAANTNPPLW